MPDKNKLAVGIFILSEANFFLVLIVAYVYFFVFPSPGPSAAGSLDPERTLGFSIALFASSATVHMAVRNFKQGDRRKTMLWLLTTLVLGAIFISGQVLEFLHLDQSGVTLSTNLFGTTFFTLTGFHGLHVVVGLFVLSIMFGLAAGGSLKRIKTGGFEAAVMYWHFVDAVWVVIFAIVYVWPWIA